jgi:hypothetical protein
MGDTTATTNLPDPLRDALDAAHADLTPTLGARAPGAVVVAVLAVSPLDGVDPSWQSVTYADDRMELNGVSDPEAVKLLLAESLAKHLTTARTVGPVS